FACPGHPRAHTGCTVADRRRGDEKPWLVFTGDSLLIGDVGRPDLHGAGDGQGQERALPGPAHRTRPMCHFICAMSVDPTCTSPATSKGRRERFMALCNDCSSCPTTWLCSPVITPARSAG